MAKKKLGFNPFDDIDILKGPEESGSKTAGNMAGEMTSKTAGNMTSKMTSKTAGNMAGEYTISQKSKLKKMTYYFRDDQLQAMDRLSKKAGRDKSDLARMAFDLFIKHVKIK